MDNTFLETLKLRQGEATRTLQTAQVRLQVAQNEFNLASQRAGACNILLAAEMQRVQLEAAAQEAAERAALPGPHASVSEPKPVAPEVTPTSPASSAEINKTELVRNVLRGHTSGITPNEIWKELKNQVTTAYVHSVLHRLMDRDEVGRKRHKYYLKQHPQPQTEEVASQNGIAAQN